MNLGEEAEMAQDAGDSFHRDMARARVRALWEGDAHGNRRNVVEPAWQWRWADLEPLIDQAVAAASMEDAERRVLSFVNPHYGKDYSCATKNLAGALQILLPGERARPHRHSMNALRFILQGRGATTIVDGKVCVMEERDLILTPAWTWHEHVHEGKERVVWFDSLDGPMHRYFGTAAFEPGPARDVPPTQADAAFSAPGMVPGTLEPASPPYSPLFRYPWKDACAALERMPAESDGSRLLRYVNPLTGRAVMALMDCYLMVLGPGAPTRTTQAASNIICVVAEGEGRSQIGDELLHWSRNDIFTVPRRNAYHHLAAPGGAKLFMTSDRQMLQRLGLLSPKGEDSATL